MGVYIHVLRDTFPEEPTAQPARIHLATNFRERYTLSEIVGDNLHNLGVLAVWRSMSMS